MQTKSTKNRLSNATADIHPREPKTQPQEATSSTSPSKNSTTATTVVVEAKFDKETRTLNLNLANHRVVSVGQSHTLQQHLDCSGHSHEDENKRFNKGGMVRSDGGPTAKDYSLEKNCAGKKLVDHQLQPSSEAQDCKQPGPGEKNIVAVDYPMPLVKKQGYLNGASCERILERLEIFQDNGKFDEHEHRVTQWMRQYADKENPDMELALALERGMAFSFQKDFENSESMFTSVIESEKMCQVINSNILMARAYFLLATDYRRRKDGIILLGQLFDFLRKSESLLQSYESPEDWAELYQTYGCVWQEYMGRIPDDQRHAKKRKAAQETAKYYFERAISICIEDDRERVQIKKIRYSHLRLASILLDCNSTAARIQDKAIPPSDIKEAKEHLDCVPQIGDIVPTGTRIQLLKIRSDQFYREGFYSLAKETAEKAFRLASSNRFNTELATLKERITFLDTKLEKLKHVDIRELEYSSSETCCSESE